MRTSAAGISFIKSWERCSLTPYQDQGGKWTIGWGHLMRPDEDMDMLTQDEADALFIRDLESKAEWPLNNAVRIDLTQQQYDACASLCFNIGAGNFAGSTLVRLLNGQQFGQSALQFERWIRAGGVVSAGLQKRRAAEKLIFTDGIYNNHR